jgi:transcriptional regulator with XRE-family HTH domain
MKIKKTQIKNLIRLKSLKQKDVAKQIGVSTQDWNNWMFRSVFPHYDKLQKLSKILEVETSELIDDDNITESRVYYKKGLLPPVNISIPFHNQTNNNLISMLAESVSSFATDDFVYIPGLTADIVIPFYGKQMEPILTNGDLMALRRITDYSFFNYEDIYLIVTKEQMFARYIVSESNSNQIILKSENNPKDNIEISLAKVKAIYLVVSTIKRRAL